MPSRIFMVVNMPPISIGPNCPEPLIIIKVLSGMGISISPIAIPVWPMTIASGASFPIEMGGMFTTMKIREGMGANDYSDPGPYKHPPGTVAFEFKGETAQPPRQTGPAPSKAPASVKKPAPGGHSH